MLLGCVFPPNGGETAIAAAILFGLAFPEAHRAFVYFAWRARGAADFNELQERPDWRRPPLWKLFLEFVLACFVLLGLLAQL